MTWTAAPIGRLLGCAAAAMAARLVLQPLVPADENPLLTPSALARSGALPAVFFVYGVGVYVALGLVYAWLRPPGRGLVQGLGFGALFAVMWAVFFLEPLPHAQGQRAWAIAAYPLFDATGLLMLGALWGRFVPVAPRAPRWGRPGLASCVVAVVFAGVRCASLAILPLYSWWAERPLLTAVWALGAGLWLGVMWAVLRPVAPGGAASSRAAWFAGVVVGVDLALFNGFLLLAVEVVWWDLPLRTSLDLLGLGLGVAAAERVSAGRGAIRDR